MKKYNLLRPRLTAVSLAAALALLPRYVVAEDKPPAPAASTQSGYDLEIKDGQLASATKGRGSEATLGNVVDALRDRYTTANIVLAPGLAKLKISDLKLRAGHLTDELEAIRVGSGLKFEWVGPGSAGPNMPPWSSAQTVDPTTGQLIATAPAETNTGLFVLREPMPTEETIRTAEAFNIGPYLQWLRDKRSSNQPQESREKEVSERMDELEQIVQVTLESLKQGSSVEMPSFSFHRGANLLIVVGTRDAVEVARKVVNALPGQAGFGSSGGGGGGGGRGFDGVGVPVPSSESDAATAAFKQRYGLSPTPGAPRVAVPSR